MNGDAVTEADRIKLTILLHQFTPAERLSAMEIRTVLEFIEGRGYAITKDDHLSDGIRPRIPLDNYQPKEK